MASSSILARAGLVSAVAVILGISTLSPLLKPSSDFGRPAVSGPPLYQTASAPLLIPTEQGTRAGDTRAKPNRLTSTATALLGLPSSTVAERPAVQPAAAQRTEPQAATTAAAMPPALPSQQAPPQQQAAAPVEEPAPPPIVAESEPRPKPEKRAAAPKRPKKARAPQPPIYTRAVQMSVY